MNLSDKVARAIEIIKSIETHDDAPKAEILDAISAIQVAMDAVPPFTGRKARREARIVARIENIDNAISLEKSAEKKAGLEARKAFVQSKLAAVQGE